MNLILASLIFPFLLLSLPFFLAFSVPEAACGRWRECAVVYWWELVQWGWRIARGGVV